MIVEFERKYPQDASRESVISIEKHPTIEMSDEMRKSAWDVRKNNKIYIDNEIKIIELIQPKKKTKTPQKASK